MADHLRRSWSDMRPWLGARQLPAARTGSASAGGPVSWPGPSRSKGKYEQERVMTVEVLSPHPAGNYRALVSEETDDLGDADPAGPRRARQHRSRTRAARQEHRQRELAAGYAAATVRDRVRGRDPYLLTVS